MAIKPSPRSDHRSHNQVMTTPVKRNVTSTPGGTPSQKVNSPGVVPKGKMNKNGTC